MLILTRRTGEKICIFNKDNYKAVELEVVLLGVKGNQIRLGFDAGSEYTILREEIYRQIAHEKGINVPPSKWTQEEIIEATRKRIEKHKILVKTREELRCQEV